jgi:transposase-like protein
MYRRAGSADSVVYLGESREALKRPRVRAYGADGGSEEVTLNSWKAAQDPGQWEEATMRAVLCGVSTRDMACLKADQLKGSSRSAVCRLWQKRAAVLVQELQESDLSGFQMLVLMVDAVVLSKDIVVTVALGIDTQGRKQVLGFRVGATENQQVCTELLESLHQRGLRQAESRLMLAVLDGSDALRNAVVRQFPGAMIQRCLVHKERNLRGYLSKRHWAELARLFARLRKAQGSRQAREEAQRIRVFLSDKNAQARESFEEAGDDLLRLFSLEVPNTLNRSLLSTNCIENVFKNLRRHLGRVCRWRSSTDQADLWMASGLKLAQMGFHCIRGVSDLPALIHALEKAKPAAKVA